MKSRHLCQPISETELCRRFQCTRSRKEIERSIEPAKKGDSSDLGCFLANFVPMDASEPLQDIYHRFHYIHFLMITKRSVRDRNRAGIEAVPSRVSWYFTVGDRTDIATALICGTN
eukprot:gene25942-biopygen12013